MTFLTLQEAADDLGVHYMTAYRYVRTGRLEASKIGAIWQVEQHDLQAFRDGIAAKDPEDRTASLSQFDDAWLRLFKRLTAGDEAGSWAIIQESLTSGMTARSIHDRLVAPAMDEVGRLWAEGNLDVADEHLATAITTRLVGRLGPRFVRPGRSRGTVVIAMVAGDSHGLPSAMLADVLRLHRFSVIDLGANTPTESVVAAAMRADSLIAVGLCSVSEIGAREIPHAVQVLSAAGFAEAIFVGGPTVDKDELTKLAPTARHTLSSQDAIDFVEFVAGVETLAAS